MEIVGDIIGKQQDKTNENDVDNHEIVECNQPTHEFVPAKVLTHRVLILLEYTFLFVVVRCDCAKITKNTAIRKLWDSFLFNKVCFVLLNRVVLYENSCLLSFTCFIFSMNCAVLSLSAWRFVPFQHICTLSSFYHVSLQVFHEVESSCLLFPVLCKYCCLFLTLRHTAKEKKKIRKIEFVFQFQAFCNATPVIMHCHLTQTTWLFASEYPLIWCEL